MPCLAGTGSTPRVAVQRAPRPVQGAVVAVDVAHVDPGARHIAELQPGTAQQALGTLEHRERLRVGILARSADAARMDADVRADLHPQPVRRRALGTVAAGGDRNRRDAQ